MDIYITQKWWNNTIKIWEEEYLSSYFSYLWNEIKFSWYVIKLPKQHTIYINWKKRWVDGKIFWRKNYKKEKAIRELEYKLKLLRAWGIP